MAAADGAFDSSVENAIAQIDTHGWPAGRHLILVEGQDADGNWGPPTAQFIDVRRPTLSTDCCEVDEQRALSLHH